MEICCESHYNKAKKDQDNRIITVSKERGIAMSTKRKAPAIQHKNQQQVNKRALIWTGSITAALIVVVSLIIIFL